MRNITIVSLVLLVTSAASSVHGQVDPAFFNSQPGVPFRMDQLPVLVRALQDESGRFVDIVGLELGSTRQGRQLQFRGNDLRTAVGPLAASFSVGFGDPRQLKGMIVQISQSLDAVNAELNNPAGTAPGAAGIALRIGRLTFEINRTLDIAISTPTFPQQPNPGFGPGYDAGAVDRLTLSVAQAIAATNAVIASDIGAQPPFNGIMRDLDAMATGAQRMNRLSQTGTPLPQIQAAYDPLRARARQVDAQIAATSPPPRVYGAWASLVNSMNQLTQSLQLAPDMSVRPPNGVRPPINPGRPNTAGQVIGLSDQLIGEIDGFIAAVQPTVFRIPQGPQFLNDAKSLRNQTIGLRQSVASGAGPEQLQPSLKQMDGAFTRLADRINRVAQGRPGPNIDRVHRMSDIVGGIHQLIGL